jgi:hypothetical protein
LRPRSYFQLRAGERMPGEGLHLSDPVHSRTHWHGWPADVPNTATRPPRPYSPKPPRFPILPFPFSLFLLAPSLASDKLRPTQDDESFIPQASSPPEPSGSKLKKNLQFRLTSWMPSA